LTPAVPDRSQFLTKRIDRLDALIRSLTREAILFRQGQDPLLYLERRKDLKALGGAVSGLETARIVLAKAHQRIGGEAKK
jgi:hypothetical protein